MVRAAGARRAAGVPASHPRLVVPLVAALISLALLGPAAGAAHVYRFHLQRSKSAAEVIRNCEGDKKQYALPRAGKTYLPTSISCALSDGNARIGWRQLGISTAYELPGGRYRILYTFRAIGFHAVRATVRVCTPGQQPPACEARQSVHRGAHWSNVF